MIITKIKRLRGKRQRYSVLLEGGPALELSDWTIGKYCLCTGDDLDEHTVDKINSTEAETQAKNIAINYLSYRQRSSKEIIDHLIKKGVTPGCAEDVTHQLQSARLVSDLDFAQSFVRDRLKRKPTGQALLRMQLMTKGITSSMADKVLAELVSPQSQQASALQAAKRKIQVLQSSKRNLDEEKQKKRLLDYLLRRGFSYELAIKTIRTALEH